MAAMEVTVVFYIVIAAQSHGWHYLFFPGLAALSHDALTRPWGKWASQPGRLVVTPVLGAAIGTLIIRVLPYGVLAILLVVASCVLILAMLKSNIAPMIAAGVLPLCLDIKSWLYPVSVAVSMIVLVSLLLPWQKYRRNRYRENRYRENRYRGLRIAPTNTDDVLESLPTATTWVLPFFAFVTIMAFCASASGLRLILFPPLIVIAYEMFAHPAACPWAGRPMALLAACFLTSSAGLFAVNLLGNAALAAACAMIIGIIILRLLHLHLPPALALGLLPLVIHSPNGEYPISVAIGTAALTLAFLLYQRWIIGKCRAGRSAPDSMRSE